MTLDAVLAELETAGNEATRAIHRRHGVLGPQYGVTFGDLRTLHKRLRTDHPLALALWATGNHDARILATMVADPARVDRALADAWLADADNYTLLDLFTGLLARTSLVRDLAETWAPSADEWTGRAGWNLLGYLALNAPGEGGADAGGRPKGGRARSEAAGAEPLPDAFFAHWLAQAERRIHDSPNRLRESMNAAVIAIGLRNPALQEQAIAAARRIGKVHVDHGETGCKTPDAEPYILKAAARARR